MKDKRIIIFGGSGSLGQTLISRLCENNELLVNHVFHGEKVPDEVHIGEWSECYDYAADGYALGGCTLSLDGNEESHVINMDEKDLKKLGVKLIREKQTIEESVKPGEVCYFFSGIQDQDGGWSGELEIEEPFDPKKLELTISHFQSREIITDLVYDGHEIECSEGSYESWAEFEVIKVDKTRAVKKQKAKKKSAKKAR